MARLKLDGKVSLVTGASRGIGAAIALALAEAGSNVMVNYHTLEEGAGATASAIQSLGRRSVTFKADVSQASQVTRMVQACVKAFGRLDVLVNNAGHSSKEVWLAPLDKITEAMWDRVLEVDLRGCFLCSKEASAHMFRVAGGKIINVASTPALTGDVYGIPYTAAKAGILGLTKALARSLAPAIQVNAMAFGSIDTEWLGWLNKRQISALLSEMPLKRFGKPEEVGKLAVFLASNDSDFITGQTIVIDGGAYMH